MEDRTSWPRLARPVGALLTVVGVAHLVAPDRLLSLARTGYGTVLDVEFAPRDGARTRVRLLGALFVAAGAHLLYHGGVLPRGD
ncbi:hypothetical protein [Haloarchaeobius sp. HRN-SO-5]|uniref:hypothetical protein n=1 Tax=Haloarchaeobius sp. HRN-SO-5 TaxID=3446118 RepID=UPI003EBBDED3